MAFDSFRDFVNALDKANEPGALVKANKINFGVQPQSSGCGWFALFSGRYKSLIVATANHLN